MQSAELGRGLFSFGPTSRIISSRSSRIGEMDLDEPFKRSPEIELRVLDSYSERRPCKVAATGPLTTISSTPLTLAISPVLPLRLHQHYTLHTELLNYTATLRRFLVYSLSLCVFFLLQRSNLPSVAVSCKCTTYWFRQVSLPSCVSEGRKEEACCDLVKGGTCKTLLGAIVTGRDLHTNPYIIH